MNTLYIHTSKPKEVLFFFSSDLMHQSLFYYYFAIFSKYHGRNTNGLATLTTFSFEIFREFSVKNRFWGQHYLPSWPDDISKHGSHLQVFCTYFFPDLADFLLHYDEIVVEGEDEDGDDPADQSNEDDSSEEDGECIDNVDAHIIING